MNLKELFNDDRAVSPVIGVILMVAITVILAAVIGTFVLGLGDKVSTTTPSTSFQFDYNNAPDGQNDTLEISHAGGTTIQASQLNATVTGATANASGSTAYTGNLFGSSGDVNAGDVATLDGSSFSNIDANTWFELDAATVRVVWTAASGDSSATLGKWSGPNAN